MVSGGMTFACMDIFILKTTKCIVYNFAVNNRHQNQESHASIFYILVEDQPAGGICPWI